MGLYTTCAGLSFWRWRVVFAKFLVTFFAFGLYKSFGVLLPHLVRGLNTNVTSVGWGFGLYGGLVYLLGPIASALTRSYGARKIVVSGGVIAAIGFTSASFASNSVHLVMAFTLSGLGHGLCVLPSIEPIAYYFQEGFALANGIALGGASIGMMVLPPISEKLVELYGWKGTLLILGALDFHIVFAGALMRMSEERPSSKIAVLKYRNVGMKAKTVRNGPSKSFHYNELFQEMDEDVEDEPRPLGKVGHHLGSKNINVQRIAEDTKPLLDNVKKQRHVIESEKCLGKDENTLSVSSFQDFLVEAFDVKLFAQEPAIIFYDVVIFLFAFTYGAWTVYLVPHAVSRGIKAKHAALLSTIAGFTNFFGRIAYAPFIDKNLIDSKSMFAIVSIITSLMFLCDSLFDTYLTMSISAAIVGLVIGAGNSLWTIMIKQFVDECGTGSFLSTLGWACLFSGLGCMLSSPLTGWFYDTLNDYDLVFQMMGVVSAVVFIVLCALKITQIYIS